MDDLHIFLKGFLLNAGLIGAIGMQNAFILAVGLARRFVLPVVLVCAVGDALLITIGVLAGAAGGDDHWWTDVLSLAGAVFLLWFGAKATRAAFAPVLLTALDFPSTKRAAIVTAVAMSLLNPHAILDMTVIFGGVSAQLPPMQKIPFAIGGIVMSFVWIFSIGYGAAWCAPLLSKPAAWRVINTAIAVMMFAIALSLLYSLATKWF